MKHRRVHSNKQNHTGALQMYEVKDFSLVDDHPLSLLSHQQKAQHHTLHIDKKRQQQRPTTTTGRVAAKATKPICTTPVIFIIFVIMYFMTCFIVILFCIFSMEISSRRSTLATRNVWKHVHREWHPANRRDRFPSVQKRVNLYMNHHLSSSCEQQHKPTTLFQISNLHRQKQNVSASITLRVQLDQDDQFNDLHNSKINNSSSSFVSIQFDRIMKREHLLCLDRSLLQDCERPPWKVWSQHLFLGQLFTDIQYPTSFHSNFVQDRSRNVGICQDFMNLHQMMSQIIQEQTSNDHPTKITNNLRIPPLLAYLDGADDARTQSRATESSTAEKNITAIAQRKLPVFGAFALHSTQKGEDCTRTTTSFNSDKNENHARAIDGNGAMIMFLDSQRLLDHIQQAARRDFLSFTKKKPMAVWRGSERIPKSCPQSVSCRFVMRYSRSSLVDAGYSNIYNRDTMLRKYDNVELTRDALGLFSLQRYRILIHIHLHPKDENHNPWESMYNLAWKLYSKSVLLLYIDNNNNETSRTIQSSWLMEEYLEPWVHYVPLNETNAEERVNWILQHSQEAERIAERATLFIHDLFFASPDAQDEEFSIKQEMLKRYIAQWTF